jgi:hypothetical protein
MNRYARVSSAVTILLLLFTSASSAGADSKCDCPKDDPAAHGHFETLIDKELSSAEKMPASGQLGFPRTVTVCMFFDPTNKGYPQDLKLVVEGSIDGRNWYPASVVGRNDQAAAANACVEVAPTRFVRVGWPPAANILSPGPHVTAQVQVSY